jgi:hypothetical protein
LSGNDVIGSKMRLDVSSLKAGIYVVRITAEDMVFSKIIVEK